MTAAEERLHIFATIRPKPEFLDVAKQALEDLIPPTLAEPGCHLFTVHENRDTPGVLHLFEIFDDDAAVQEHYEQDYTKDVFAKYQNWLDAPVEIQHLKVTASSSSDQFKTLSTG